MGYGVWGMGYRVWGMGWGVQNTGAIIKIFIPKFWVLLGIVWKRHKTLIFQSAFSGLRTAYIQPYSLIAVIRRVAVFL
jgi:hypothetical protein